MKKILKNLLLTLDDQDLGFISIDCSNVSCFIYSSVVGKPPQLKGHGVAKAEGIESCKITNIKLFSNSIGKALDLAENMAQKRIKKIVLNFAIPSHKTVNYNVSLEADNTFTLSNLAKYVDIRALSLILGEDYFITNLLPYNFTETKINLESSSKNININLVIAGYSKKLLEAVLKVFNRFSIEVIGLVYSPFTLPYIIGNVSNYDAILNLSYSNILLFSNSYNEILNFGNSFILYKISERSNIPKEIIMETVKEIEEFFNKTTKHVSTSAFLRIKEFIIDNPEKIIEEAIIEYAQKLKGFMHKKGILEPDKHILILDYDLELFNKKKLFYNVFKDYNVEFKKIIISNSTKMQSFINSDILNMGLVGYYYLKASKDLGFTTFKNRASVAFQL